MDTEIDSVMYNASKNKLFGIELVFIDYMNYFNTIDETLLDNKRAFEIDYFINKDAREDKMKKNYKMDNGELGFIEEQAAEQFYFLTTTYPNYFRSFFLTQLYAFIENELRILCNYHKKLNRYVENAKTPYDKRSELEKTRNYLLVNCRINEDLLNADFEILERARRIRNKILHTNGMIRSIEKDFKYFSGIANNGELIKLEEKSTGNYLLVIKSNELIELVSKAGESIFINLLTNKEVKFL